jgi:NTP pyrophosphatase (non-canonical NTP hydrolase)
MNSPCTNHGKMENLIDDVIDWADERGLLREDFAKNQMLKVVEEIGELSAALVRDDIDEVIDAIGDSFITLIILSSQLGLEPEDCLRRAYDQIADRKGQTIDGVFIKES